MSYRVELISYEDFVAYNNSLASKNLPCIEMHRIVTNNWTEWGNGYAMGYDIVEETVQLFQSSESKNNNYADLLVDPAKKHYIDPFNFSSWLVEEAPLILILIDYFKAPKFQIVNPDVLKDFDFSLIYAIINPRKTVKYLNSILPNLLLLGDKFIDIGPLRLTCDNKSNRWKLALYDETYSRVAYLPEFVKVIGEYSFTHNHGGLTHIEKVVCYSNEIAVDNNAFQMCTYLKGFLCRGGITHIGKSAFYHCTNLTAVPFSDKLVCIGKYAFACCKSFKTLTLPKNISLIEEGAFINCENLSHVNFEKLDNLKYIHGMAFSDCNLVKVQFSETSKLKKIMYLAFEGNHNLIEVKLPSELTEIGLHAFLYCHRLSVLDLGKTKLKACELILSVWPLQILILPEWCQNSDDVFKLQVETSTKTGPVKNMAVPLHVYNLPHYVKTNRTTYDLRLTESRSKWLKKINNFGRCNVIIDK